MKKAVLMSFVFFVLSGCATTDNSFKKAPIANPASIFCEHQGGSLEPKKDAEGNEYELCHFAGGQVIEAWEFYRMRHSQ